MNKYHFGDVYLLMETDLFDSHETMLEYVTDNWEDYCVPVGDDPWLVSVEPADDSKITFHFGVHNYDTGDKEFEWHTISWETMQITHRVSDLLKTLTTS